MCNGRIKMTETPLPGLACLAPRMAGGRCRCRRRRCRRKAEISVKRTRSSGCLVGGPRGGGALWGGLLGTSGGARGGASWGEPHGGRHMLSPQPALGTRQTQVTLFSRPRPSTCEATRRPHRSPADEVAGEPAGSWTEEHVAVSCDAQIVFSCPQTAQKGGGRGPAVVGVPHEAVTRGPASAWKPPADVTVTPPAGARVPTRKLNDREEWGEEGRGGREP